PTLSNISPSSGATSGGTAVTISGTGFQNGLGVTIGGSAAANVSVTNSSTITATTPPGAAGVANVTVTNPDGQTATLASAYTYVQAPPPSVSSVSPNTGNPSGGNSVSVLGANFQTGAAVTFGGVAATNIIVQNSGAISVVTPANPAGAVDVVVTNPDGQSATLTSGFTYSSSAPGPETVLLNSIDTTNWTVGSLFSGTTDPSVPVSVANQQLQVGPLDTNTSGSHYNGLVTAKTYNITGGYAYIQLVGPPASNTAADAMLTIGPDVNDYYRIYYEAGNLICQKRVAGGSKVTLFTGAYSATADSFLRIRNDSTAGNVVFEVAQNASGAPGSWTQVYSEPWSSSISLTSLLFELKAGTFQVETNAPGTVDFSNFRAAVPGSAQDPPAPSLSSISPSSGPTSGGVAVTISGSGFQSGLTVMIGGAQAGSVSVMNSSTVSAMTPPGQPGTVGVSVTNPDGQAASMASAYTYVQAPPPSIASVSPNSGNTAGGDSVGISGSNFQSGATVTFGTAAATNVVVQNSSTVSVVTPPNSAGAVNVTVTNPDGQSATLASGFTYSSSGSGETVLLNSLDTTNWTLGSLFSGTTDSSVPAKVTNQQLKIGPLDLNTSSSHYNGLVTVKTYNMTGGYAYIQLLSPPASNTAADAMLTIGTDVNNYYRIYYEAGNLICQKRVSGGAKVTMVTTPYNATAVAFIRIRNDSAGGNVIFETAPNSSGVPGTWTQVYSEPWSPAVSLVKLLFELKAGTWQAESNPPGTVVFTNFRAAVPQ
ncbi:MAG TPA: IPT/TIG domain-containing protein, partial [Blastocatellia bacterium]|nr:IPT/TIG domain-containing protein [Blastocatellia bacterium]